MIGNGLALAPRFSNAQDARSKHCLHDRSFEKRGMDGERVGAERAVDS